jgi:glycosyltransferase involved in cell wall biosynthesis
MLASLHERVVLTGVESCAPRISVLTPFHRHDPSPLLHSLSRAATNIEFILLDDGSASATLLADVVHACGRLDASARIIVWRDNKGRAAARNRLVQEARGEYVLFLDADMAPDGPRFLQTWLDTIDRERPLVVFGGLSVTNAVRTHENALHYDMFAHSDCRAARARAREPTQFAASANLLVRRDFLQTNPFDDGFVGWGFEDVDWALRAAQHTPILHIDNAATHVGLDEVTVLLRKSRQAGPNFARLARRHPKAVARFAASRVARLLKRTPSQERVRPLLAWLAQDPVQATPMWVRRIALKLYRASHYAEHLV